MSDTARDYQTDHPAATDGLDDLFVEAVTGYPQEGDTQGLPVEEVAKIFGVSHRTVLKRLRKGSLPGFKVSTKFGEKWMVSPMAIPQDSSSLVTYEEEPVTVSDVTESRELTGKVIPGDPQEGPGEGVSGDPLGEALLLEGPPSDTTSRLLDILEKQSKELQAANWRNGHLETRVQDLESQLASKAEEIKLLMDSQHKSGKWARFKAWFFGQ